MGRVARPTEARVAGCQGDPRDNPVESEVPRHRGIGEPGCQGTAVPGYWGIKTLGHHSAEHRSVELLWPQRKYPELARAGHPGQGTEEPRLGRAGSVPRQGLRAAPDRARTPIGESRAVPQALIPIPAVSGSAGSAAPIRVPGGGGAAQGGSRDEPWRSGHRLAPPGSARPGAARTDRGGGSTGRVSRGRAVPARGRAALGSPRPGPPAAMAARILHRLRHALAGEGGREEPAGGGGEAEDCPESSELEDDTEGLSTRLSGTLSFTSHEDEEEEEDGDGASEELEEPPQAPGAAAGTEDGGRCWGGELGGLG